MRTRKFNWIQSPILLACGLVLAFVDSRPAAAAQPDQLLHSFKKAPGNDHAPNGVIRDAAGNLYGTTRYGLNGQAGNVFELSPQQGGGWTYTVLHSFKFNSGDGNYPQAGLVTDLAGNLYGTTVAGGTCSETGGCGTVFEVSPQSAGGWTEKVLYSFQATGGTDPYGGSLVLDASGNLYGATVYTDYGGGGGRHHF